MKKALIIIDYINEICHRDGKLAGKWYADFIESHNTIHHINTAISDFRKSGGEVLFVKVAFQKWYTDQPKWSPLLGKAHEFWILEDGSWGVDFLDSLDVWEGDPVFIKNRISAFYSELDNYLKQHDITDLSFCWCATDLAVESTAREAHDKDYKVTVYAHACAAANTGDHERALKSLEKISTIL